MEFYLTKERLEELKKELAELKNVARPKVADQLKRAKEFGDLSENWSTHRPHRVGEYRVAHRGDRRDIEEPDGDREKNRVG